ncbi:MAG TPA: class I SAM-dependent methyltransferase [Acidobacteriota bacterium]|nr:class I SAM-dependent methyltransferase [Acidobacteriota bacterium]
MAEDIARKKIIKKYYSERAGDYDRQKIRTWQSEQGFGTKIIDEINDALSLGNKAVLEVGVGSGRISLALREKIQLCFVGLDLSREMLDLAKMKMSSYKQKSDFILGDAEHLPLTSEIFDAIICISTMHYFGSPKKSLTEFSRMLKEKGVLVYGDLTVHESDNSGFLDTLEGILSKAHARYFKSSEMKITLERYGFHILKMTAFPYRKSFSALMEDKGMYFDVKLETLSEYIEKAAVDAKKLYLVDNSGLTLFYTLIIASKEK